MTKFLFTMLPANDLGLPTRMVPIARALADRGHQVAVFNPAPAPAKLIAEAGLLNLPVPSRPMPPISGDFARGSAAWDVEELFAGLYSDETFVSGATAVYLDLIGDYAPDVVVDSFDLIACLATRILKVPLVTVLQGNFHPASHGFLWWESQPPQLPGAAPVINKVAAEHSLPPVRRCVDYMAGDLSLIVGTPETDPLPSTATVTHVGPIVWQRGNAALPDWLASLPKDKPLIWVYSGNPRYGSSPNPFDSIIVIRAAIAAFGDAPVQVVLTTGHQELPEEFAVLPANFHHVAYLPGPAMAARADLMVHHGGHSSVMTGLLAGTPAVIIPTSTERESNARRLTEVGAGEIVRPVKGDDGEKHIDVGDFRAKVNRVVHEPGYRRCAQRIAASMRSYGGASEAADRIVRFADSIAT
jgi:UDP:flavonoid glycosyltransferase YjiC (YdhE family)